MTKRILVIDDSSTIQKVIRIAFASFDVKVDTAENYVEAVSAIHLNSPTIILADASLPGTQSARDFVRLRDEAKGAPLILLWGSYEEGNEEDFRTVGLTAIVRKPFDATDIVMQVKKVLGYEFARRRPAAATNTPSSSRVLDGLTASIPPREHPDLPAVGPIVGRVQDWEPQINAELHDLAAEHQNLASTLPGSLMDNRRKGEKAFGSGPEVKDSAPKRPVSRPSEEKPASSLEMEGPSEFVGAESGRSVKIPGYELPQPAKVKSILEPLIRDELAKMVHEAVEDFCQRNFTPLAREVITSEIRRLVEEKSRHLVDN